jgi:hypothetical protein
MATCYSCDCTTQSPGVKIEVLARWIKDHWIPDRPGHDWLILSESYACAHAAIQARFDRALVLPGGYTFQGEEALDCPATVPVNEYQAEGTLARRTGAFVYQFANAESGETVEALVLATYFSDEGHMIAAAAVPAAFMPAWTVFARECQRIAGGFEPKPLVQIIGGRSDSFVPAVDWADIVLPSDLKDELMRDVESFFSKGIGIYQRLKLKPFRKLLLAGVPGTGKTMICSALAQWALERQYVVIYVSSADYCGAAFWKIEQALAIAANSNLPALILLEELDAYLTEEDEKALVLNVLDGAEARENEQGTLLIATTNYPEAIDARILKRPGRLDRIFIIPETRDPDAAERMLRHYLGEFWRDEHRAVARDLVGYPGAFVREVALYALTQMAYNDQTDLPLGLLQRSFNRLLDQITAKDDFLTAHRRNGYGFVIEATN